MRFVRVEFYIPAIASMTFEQADCHTGQLGRMSNYTFFSSGECR
jgi:hypothetical protein